MVTLAMSARHLQKVARLRRKVDQAFALWNSSHCGLVRAHCTVADCGQYRCVFAS